LMTAGDVNGDRQPDLLLSAANPFSENLNASTIGVAKLFFWSAGQSTPTPVLVEDGANHQVPYAFPLGDVNSDGVDDIGVSDFALTYQLNNGSPTPVYREVGKIYFGSSELRSLFGFPDLVIEPPHPFEYGSPNNNYHALFAPAGNVNED